MHEQMNWQAVIILPTAEVGNTSPYAPVGVGVGFYTRGGGGFGGGGGGGGGGW